MSRSSTPGRIKVIAGRWRGRYIAIPDSPELRPTPSRVRETLFNWLAPEIEGARCLDLFAGTGALGIEALSRGAAGVTFVETRRSLISALRAQLEELDEPGAAAQLVHASADDFLSGTQARFDLVFADPPFGLDAQPVCAAIGPILRPGGALYCERAAADGLPDLAWGQWQRQGRAGDVCFGLARAHRDD